jgi:hypothetical protein
MGWLLEAIWELFWLALEVSFDSDGVNEEVNSKPRADVL